MRRDASGTGGATSGGATATDPSQLPVAACCVPLRSPALSDDEARTIASTFKALADPQRVRIVHLLAAAEPPVCVCDVTAAVGLAQATVSYHLRKLLDAGLVTREQRGTWAYYQLQPAGLEQLATVVLEGDRA